LNTPNPAFPFPDHSAITLYEFPDNIGHLMDENGRDGWGRAFTEGLLQAAAGDHTHAVHIETDLLFMRPVAPILAALQTRAAAPRAVPHDIPDTGLLFMRIDDPWVINFIARYDWPSFQPSKRIPMPTLPEQRIRDILGADLAILDLPGRRNEGDTAIGVSEVGSLIWLTHCGDRAIYEAFMKAHGFEPI
jgi:hypothetical protein